MDFQKYLFLIILIFISFHLMAHASFAQEQKPYIVRSHIVIPTYFKNFAQVEGKINTYKQAINWALEESQQLYRSILNGKTFTFVRDIDVIDNGSLQTEEDIEQLKHQEGYIDIYWVLATPNGRRWARFTPLRDSGIIFMRHQDLLALDGRDSNAKKISLYALSHELGHTFGLAIDGYAKAHPCTIDSPQECLPNTPEPLPGGVEWESIMGYGTPYIKWPNLTFNNSLCNPELNSLYKSPFLNPQLGTNGPQPGFCSPPIRKFNTGLDGNPIPVGKSIRFPSLDFGSSRGKISFISPPSSTPPVSMSEEDYIVEEWNNEVISIRIKNSRGPDFLEQKWRLHIISANGEVFQSRDDVVIVKNSYDSRGFYIRVHFTLICGPDNKPVRAGTYLTKEGEDNPIIASTNDNDGKGTLLYLLSYPQSGSVYYAVPFGPFYGYQGTTTPESHAITIPNPVQSVETTIATHYSVCPPEDLRKPVVLPLAQDSQINQVLVSNYDDFRLTNAPNDIGSNTLVINNPQEEQTFNWGLSTTNQLKYVYIREIYANQAVRDYTLPLGESQRGTLGNIHIVANRQENITKVTINGRELNLNDPNIQVDLNSVGRMVPIQLTYSNGNVRSIIMDFQNISQSVPTPSSTAPSPPNSVPISTGVCFRHPQLGNVKESGCTGGCDGSGCGLMGYYVCSVSGDVSSSVVTACSDQCQRCVTSTPTPAPINISCVTGDCNGAPGTSAKCTNGLLELSWNPIEGAKKYLLRIDRDPDSWGGYSNLPGDLFVDNHTGTFNGKPYVARDTERNHRYKWWFHAAYDEGPYEGVMYKGRFGQRIDGGIVTCR